MPGIITCKLKVGHSFTHLIHRDDSASIANEMKRLFKPPYNITVECRALTKRGWRWQEWRNTSILDEQKVVTGFIGVGRDISERKLTEQKLASFSSELENRVNERTRELESSNRKLLEAQGKAESAMAHRERFLANISHEIRTPMNGVLGMVDLLKMTDLNSEQAGYVKTIHQSGNVLLAIINNVLDYSKLDAGSLVLERQSFSIEKLIKGTLEPYRAGLSDEIILDYSVDSLLKNKYMLGDVIRLSQVLSNLINNACKFTDAGYVRVSALSESEANNRVCVRFSVSDSGSGIDPERHEEMLQPFTQADTSTSRQYGGTGLGLSICSHLLTLMGSSLEIESVPGTGSNFTFTIGFDLTSRVIEAPKLPLSVVAGAKQIKVLLVEDNVVNAQVATILLRKLGAEVSALAVNGCEAVSLLHDEETVFDLILMDCEMPLMDGYEATELIRDWEQKNNKKRTLIYALTAHALDEHIDHCFEVGMDGHVSKPINALSIKNLLDEVLDIIVD